MFLPEKNTSYYKLTVFQKSKKLVLLVYKITRNFPKEELFSLVPQMRRAAISIVANIVEGYSKNYTKEFIRFLNISIGSATELKIYLELSLELGYLPSGVYEESQNLLTEIRKMLYSYKKTLGNKIKE